MTEPLIDIVTVVHNDKNKALADRMIEQVRIHHQDLCRVIVVDNSVINRGFARACNEGAAKGDAPVIGFLNPDVTVHGVFIPQVYEAMHDDRVVITGNRYGKPDHELRIWGVADWVCGATMFVRRDFWTRVKGFDERFVWSYEETDLIRRAEKLGYITRPIALPIKHASPNDDNAVDTAYKAKWFEESQRRYIKKWAKP